MEITNNLIGKEVIIRGNNSGVFFETLAKHEGQIVELHNCRRIWYWSGAATLHQLAAEGIKNKDASKISMAVSNILILDAIEILPCTKQASENIKSVKAWKV